MIKPAILRHGDLIGIISPAGPVNRGALDRGITYLEGRGYRVKLGQNALEMTGYLAGDDQMRLKDLHDMFLDPDINAVFMSRGGYGTGRLLPGLDYGLIGNNPKILMGYSDITALQLAVLKQTGMVTFSGPMVAPDFGGNLIPEAAKHCFSALSGEVSARNLSRLSNFQVKSLNGGKAEGKVICGCLSIVASIVGTAFCPDFENTILVLEDIGEEPYRIDRAVTTLELHGVFERISGLVLGRFTGCTAEKETERHISPEDIFRPFVEKYGIPAVYNFAFGHIPEKLTIPIGINAELDAGSGSFILTENPFTDNAE